MNKKEKMYKIFDKNGHSCDGGNVKWSLPRKQKDGSWKAGKWMPIIKGEVIACGNGYHLCREKDLLSWLNDSIYVAEYRGKIIKSDDEVVVRQVRLSRKCENWNERTARLFACWCIRNTPLENGGTVWDLLTDDRSRNAVKTAEQFANGKATKGELAAARADAEAATRAASSAAIGGPTWGTIGAGKWATASAMGGTTRSAVLVAAEDTMGAAARGIARATLGVIWDLARAAQTKELLRTLNEELI